jgi:hypothetical protein
MVAISWDCGAITAVHPLFAEGIYYFPANLVCVENVEAPAVPYLGHC